jgi:hypothetical protein
VALALSALISVSWWLLARGTRGAEIATVLALPLAIIATAAAIRALSQRKEAVRARLEDRDGRALLLVRANEKINDQLGSPDARNPRVALRFERRPSEVTRGNKSLGLRRGLLWDEDETSLQILADRHRLLVLGDIGSGKTTVLFELARYLFPVPDDYRTQSTRVVSKPIPVVLNLSAWGEPKESEKDDEDDNPDGTRRLPSTEPKFEDWMVSALHVQYDIPLKLGRILVDDDELLPLFDGLDEVSARHRDRCVQAINGFGRAHSVETIVVSCRREEYEKIPTRLSFQEAVVIKLPTLEEARSYLLDCGVQGALHYGVGNGDLRPLLCTPLVLELVSNVYAGQPEHSGDLVSIRGTSEQILGRILSAYEDRMLVLRPVPRYFWSDRSPDQPPREVEANWKFHTVVSLVWLARLMCRQIQNEFHLDRLQPDCLPTSMQRHLVVVLPAVCMGLVTSIVMILIIAFSWPFTVAVPWGLLGGFLIGLDSLGWRTLLRRQDRPVIDPVEEVRWKWSRTRLTAGAGIGAAVGLAVGLIARLLGELRGLIHVRGVWDSSLFVLHQLGEWPAWLVICIAAMGACAVMSGLGGGLSKGRTVPNEGILRSARRALSIGIPAGLFGGFVAGVVIRPIASVYTAIMMSFFFACAIGLVFGGRACLRHVVLRFLLVYNGFAPLNYKAFLQDSADRLFLRRSASGYTFVHQVVRDYFAKYYDPDDPPYTRSAFKALKAAVRLPPLSR